jgi:hypothetical protein
MLVRIVDESQVMGKDHEIVLETLSALGRVGTDAGIPTIVGVIGRRGWFRRARLRALKTAGVEALAHINSPAAASALDEAARTGDRMLKRIAAARRA